MSRNIVGYLLAALIAGIAAWFYLNFERVAVREHVGLRGEAAVNPLLALTRLVERMGVQARSAQRVEDLDALEASATVFLPAPRRGYSTPQLQRLARWIEAGGHLIVEAARPQAPDELLDKLDVSRKEGPVSFRGWLAEVNVAGAKPLRVQLKTSMELVDGDPQRTRFVSKDADGTHLLHFAYGRGRVTVLPSFAFMTNDAIGQDDHAELAWRLVQLAPATSMVMIAPQAGRPSLFRWLAREARAPLIALFVLLLLWAWRAGTRFGPVLPEPGRERRRLLDHLRASGRFLWRSGEASQLLAAARETCLQKIARTRPGLIELPPGERDARLATLTGLASRDIALAFSGEPGTPAAFTAIVRTLQQIEEQLTRRLTA